MPLETGTYISDLVGANPAAGDATNQGDDHVRLVKTVLKNTFPNVNAAVTATPTNLNNGYIPVGGIILWSGSIASIPSNWHICDGTTGTPDLRDRFVIGAGLGSAVGAFGGSVTTTSDGSHSHTGNTGGHTLTAGEVPFENAGASGSVVLAYSGSSGAAVTSPHTHPISADGAHTHNVTPPYYALAYIQRTG